jgi:hypothetical protein
MITKEKVIEETIVHKKDVTQAMQICKAILNHRAKIHDNDKLIPENAQVLAEAINTKDFEKWNVIHMETQRHHIDCFTKLPDANLFDLLENVEDGCVANLRRTGIKGTYESQIEFYQRKGFDENMSKILTNTFMIIQDLINLEE